MKADIHPEYHEITVVMTDGSKFKTRSTWGKPGDTMRLDIDQLTHPAWTGATGYINENANQVAKFNKRFGGLSMQHKPAAAAPAASDTAKPAAAPAAKAEKKKKSENPA